MVRAMNQAKVGVRLRRFREERGLTQAGLARALGISPSYVNQLESNQRPITAAVLLRLASVFDADIQQFSTDQVDRLVAQLRDVIAESGGTERVSMAEARELAQAMPSVATTLIDLYRRYRRAVELNEAMGVTIDAGAKGLREVLPPTAYEEVRDLFYAHRNYFPALDEAAEAIFAGDSLTIGDTEPGLVRRLRGAHRVNVTELGGESGTAKRRYDPVTRTLALSPRLTPAQRAFQLATHLALVELRSEIDQIVDDGDLSSEETRALARIGLANYVAGALLLPYGAFLSSAETLRYDIELLQRRFRVGYETVAHRLSTLQRPGARAVPFIFIRVDRAGNISKRQSATDFHFSRVGGTCPLWNVYEAFAQPGRIQVQLAQMPDQRSYLWVARTVTRHTGGHGVPGKNFAIGLGCDLHHARRLVYSDGLDLTNPKALTPIGPGCKICDRDACPQRAFPAIGKALAADDNLAHFIPYSPPP
jgi:XRE family transcriptional regulator, fatty acid utilization regulator